MANWLPEASQGGYWQAQAEDLGADSGVKIMMKSGGPGVQTVTNVAIGEADYGMTAVDNIYAARAQGIPIVGIFAPLDHSPQCLLTHPEANIKTFKDLNGKKVAVSPAGNFFKYIKMKYDITPSEELPTVPLSVWADDPNMVVQCFSFSEPYVAEQNNWPATPLMVSESGYDPYSQVLFTTEKRIQEHPDEVRAVVQASKTGWEHFVQGDATAGIKLILSQNPDYTEGEAKFSIKAMGDLMGKSVGAMDPDRWKALFDDLVEVGAVPSSINWQDAFSTEFLDN